MNYGNISEMVLNRSVLKHIRKYNKIIEGGAAAGNDAALLDIRENEGLLVAEGYSDSAELPKGFDISSGDTAYIDCLYMAYIRACNNLYAMGGSPEFISVKLIMGSEVREGYVRSMMKNLSDRTAEAKVAIIGGDTKITEVMRPEFLAASVTACGCLNSGDSDTSSETSADCKRDDTYSTTDRISDHKISRKISVGDHVIIAGYAGLYGAAVLSKKHHEYLRERFAESYIDRVSINDIRMLSIEKAALAAYGSSAKRVHDVSFGGVYAAVYQIAEAAGLGVKVRHEDIPIRQETIELSEDLGINPYMLCSTGSLVIAAAADKAESVAEAIRRETGLSACDAGEFTKEKLRSVYSNNFRLNRVIDMPDGDELFNVYINM